MFNLNTWHAGAENTNGKPRKTIFIQIKKRDEGQLLNYKKFLSKKTKMKLNEAQKYLLAIRRGTQPRKRIVSVLVKFIEINLEKIEALSNSLNEFL